MLKLKNLSFSFSVEMPSEVIPLKLVEAVIEPTDDAEVDHDRDQDYIYSDGSRCQICGLNFRYLITIHY